MPLTGGDIYKIVQRLVPNPSGEDFTMREVVHGFEPGAVKEFTAFMIEGMPEEANRSHAFALGFVLGLTVGHAQGIEDNLR